MIRAVLSRPFEQVAPRLVAGGADFATPLGEPAMVAPDSVSWRVFRNPVSMYVGGVAAVLLELGEPRVRTAVWEHSSFRYDPAGRLRRTGMAAMMTVYGARSRFDAMAARVNAMHGRIAGETPAGNAYRADDPELLRWVQATAAYGFLSAYRAFVAPVSPADGDRYYAEARQGAAAFEPPSSEAEMAALLDGMRPRLEPSPILSEVLEILRTAPILPAPVRSLQHVVVRAAVDLVPKPIRAQLGLGRHGGLSRAEHLLLRTLGRTALHVRLPSSPAEQARRRIGAS